MFRLDHIVVSGARLDAAQSHAEKALGQPMQDGGAHAMFHTHNKVMGLEGGIYLESIAADPSQPAPQRPRWYDLDRFEGPARLTNWAIATDDIEAAAKDFTEAGEIVSLERGDLKWRMMVPKSGILPFDNLFPAIIQWDVADIPQTRLAPQARLKRLDVRHPYGQALSALLEPVFSDARVVISEGPARLSATLETSQGVCRL